MKIDSMRAMFIMALQNFVSTFSLFSTGANVISLLSLIPTFLLQLFDSLLSVLYEIQGISCNEDNIIPWKPSELTDMMDET